MSLGKDMTPMKNAMPMADPEPASSCQCAAVVTAREQDVKLFRAFIALYTIFAGPLIFGLGFAARCFLKDAIR